MSGPGVLMVTGAYHPEVSGGGSQCRTLVRALSRTTDFAVLTTTADPSLPSRDEVDGVRVERVLVEGERLAARAKAARRLASAFARHRRRVGLVHIHGFSRKSMLLVLLARAYGKKVVMKLTSAGADDPVAIGRQGTLSRWCYRQADCFVGVSPRLEQLFRASGLAPDKFVLIPNGVDLARFRPGDEPERRTLRERLGLPDGPLVLFVGLFSREKCPDVLFEAWARVAAAESHPGGLVFVGATEGTYHEIDGALAPALRKAAAARGLGDRLRFVERTHEVEAYYRAADVFAMPSTREGLPNALLEAMATGLPCVASRLPGVTDHLIEDGVNGLLVAPGDAASFEAALRVALADRARARELGLKARRTIEARFSIDATAARYAALYDGLRRRDGAAARRCG